MSTDTHSPIPRCVGMILDGNRRWAKAQGLAPWEGHTAGYQKLREVIGWARETGIECLIVYAFSTENWRRTEEEVGHLLSLFRKFLSSELSELRKEEVRVRFIGELPRFPKDIQKLMRETEEATAAFPRTLVVAASYGGRAEILAAAAKLMRDGGEVTEERFADALSTSGIPDPDIIIRTGGEKRLSNFLPWQGTYSELFFVDTTWPAFSRGEFDGILADYARRKRNFGK